MALAVPRGRALRILVVEDHQDTRELLEEMLRATGNHAVDLAASALDGLERLRRGQGYDLVVTDFCLPGASGLDLLDQASAEGLLAHAAVVVCSASGDDELRRDVQARGARFVPKPIDVEGLLDLVRHADLGAEAERESGVKVVDDEAPARSLRAEERPEGRDASPDASRDGVTLVGIAPRLLDRGPSKPGPR